MQSKLDSSLKLFVLVIEDNFGDFVLIEDNLLDEFSNIKITHRTDFKSAIQYLQQTTEKPSIILLDLNLPDLAGIELIKGLNDYNFKIPIIVLTGYSDLNMAENSLQLGVSDYLVKEELSPMLLRKSIIFALSRNTYIKQIESQNNKLKQIAWTQSHVVRAPLSRILGIVNLLQEEDIDEKELSFLLEQIKISSIEMDSIVRKIVIETQNII